MRMWSNFELQSIFHILHTNTWWHEAENGREIESMFAWLKCLFECNKNEEYIEMLFQNLGVCIIIIIGICGSRQHQIDTPKYKHHFLDLLVRLCLCLRVSECTVLWIRRPMFSSTKFIANAANHSEWYFMAVFKSIYVAIIECTLKCNMHYTRKIICSLSLSLSFIGQLQAKLTQLSTKGFNDAMRKVFCKITNNGAPKTLKEPLLH